MTYLGFCNYFNNDAFEQQPSSSFLEDVANHKCDETLHQPELFRHRPLVLSAAGLEITPY